MNITVIAIGDELLIGQVTDTNSGTIARMIDPYGWTIQSVVTIHDNANDIEQAVTEALQRTDVVITTGGLGPTKDDITKQVLCRLTGGTLVHDDSVLANIITVFERRGIQLNDLTRQQAMVPSSCRVIQNLVGTAPIMWFDMPGNKVLVSLPGVPFEMEQMMRAQVLPQLLNRFPSEKARGHRTLILAGLTESAVAMQLDEWEQHLPQGIHLAYLPKPGIIRLRIDGMADDSATLSALLDRLHAELCNQFSDNLLAEADLTPEEALIESLRQHHLTLATAESCTGGNIAHRITMTPGCSDVYMGSVVSYANDVKINLLGVNPATIEQFGVVSEPVVAQMAEGVCRATGASCAISTSGIAGPSGATPGKPVGTVSVGIHTPAGTITTTYHLPGTRDRVIDRASTNALTLLAMTIKNL